MPTREILDLLPDEVTIPGKKGGRFVLLEDRHIYNTLTVTTTDRDKAFFQTLGSDKLSQSNFRGDQSLVREDNIFVPLQVSVFPRLRLFQKLEGLAFFNRGLAVMQIKDPQKITVLEDNLRNLAPAVGWERFTTETDINELVPYGRNFRDRRTILIPQNKIVKGGRNIDFSLQWDETAGNGLTVDTEIVSEFYGGEYEPAEG